MTIANNTLIKLWELDNKLYFFSIDLCMGRLNLVWAKFWKLPAQEAGNDFGQIFTL